VLTTTVPEGSRLKTEGNAGLQGLDELQGFDAVRYG
jgi:hypothetical protein